MSVDGAELDRLKAAFDLAQSQASTSPGCADPERIWAAMVGRLPAREARRLLSHGLSCPSCGPEWRLAREMIAGSGLLGEERPERARFPRWPRWGWLLAGATAVAAAVAIAPLLMGRNGPPASTFRSEETAPLRSLLPDRPLAKSRFVLRWTPAAAGTRYSLTVATPDLTVLHTVAGLTTAECQVPPAALSGVPAGTEILWTVEAVQPDGRRTRSPALLARLE